MDSLSPHNNPIPRPGGRLIREEAYKTFELDLETIVRYSGLSLDEINPILYDVFTDKQFVQNLPEKLKNNLYMLGEYLKNTILFSNIIHKKKEIYGETVVCPPSLGANGRTRREESGPQIVLEKIIELGIDPAKVLYFRRTQPTNESPNPESYWTSAYFETVTGLNVEIAGESRKTSVILCSTLEDIASDSELILDINDDVGLPVRRVSSVPYSQSRVLFIIQN